MEPFVIGDIWYGKSQTPYANVSAKIDAVTTRNVQVSFDRTVSLDGLQLGGTVMTHKQFRLHFDPGQQLSLW
jgi:cytoskeletal protein CcmA (bactofilin family)